MKFKGDIIITDPCYIMRKDENGNGRGDWDKCDYGDNMGALGINNFLTRSTEYGDWSCTTVKECPESVEHIKKLNENYFKLFEAYNEVEKNEILIKELEEERGILEEQGKEFILGKFCADAGLVSVFLLSEVLAYNPDFDYHINRPWTTTLIKDFDGDVEITHRQAKYFDDNGEEQIDNEVSVIGKGNINFYTTQTGL